VLLDETMMIPFEMWNSVLHKATNWNKPHINILWHIMFASYIPKNDLETTSPAVLEKMKGWIDQYPKEISIFVGNKKANFDT